MKNLQQEANWIYSFDSWITWPILTILWWVHGDETCWVDVLDFLRNHITITRGKLFLIYANIEAITIQKRQTDQNLNRMFKNTETYSEEEKVSYEYWRAQIIKYYLDQTEASLDLHSSPSAWSPAFVICENNAQNIVQNFPFKNICSGFDTVEPWGTDYYMNTSWKIGICVECGNHNAPDAMNNALISTREFLKKFDMIDWENLEKIDIKIENSGYVENNIIGAMTKQYFRAIRAYVTQTSDFRIEKCFDDFEDIQKWQTIWYDWEKIVIAQNNGKILFARNRAQSWVEGFIEIVSE